ncbi:hypothetical protein M9H77_15775 [Catharanthus roseus]|uniref:Uncharacterized protein n=1 Tax=Catharanthus roseus TaxID=4058 RepID=A0ACC0AY29_CATRO|nr:hypothetical protein M9H77_15775 [Catharanthus roseus]
MAAACMGYIYTYTLILSLISAHLLIPFAEGRQMKALFTKEKLNSFQEAPPTAAASDPNAISVTTSSNNKNGGFGTRRLSLSLSSTTTDFKPTAPGNSPGVGHSHHVVNTLSSTPDDFKPTNPGRSPGVGHSFHTMKKQPNA